MENLLIVSLSAKERIMSLTLSYMRTAHLAGLIKNVECTAVCEGLGKYLHPTPPLTTPLLSLCGQHRVANHSENKAQNFVASPFPF